MNFFDRIQSSVNSIRTHTNDFIPEVAIILGSGFAGWIDTIEIEHEVAYHNINGFPVTTVEGHRGRLLTASVSGVKVIIMQGRFHYYEGYQMQELAIPVRVFKDLGVQTLFLTNAAGGINVQFQPGQLMVIEDHINLTGNNPLIGPNLDHYGLRFPDAAKIYDPILQQIAQECAKEMDLNLQSGIYLFTSGPSFETPAEIRMMRTLGADVVGMSTVPEALVANHAGLRTFGLSLVANLASGLSSTTLTHEEVLSTMAKVSEKTNQFISLIVSRLGAQ